MVMLPKATTCIGILQLPPQSHTSHALQTAAAAGRAVCIGLLLTWQLPQNNAMTGSVHSPHSSVAGSPAGSAAPLDRQTN